MLKTSPVLTSSASPSPASLRHGHGHVHARSQSRPHMNAHQAHAHTHAHAHAHANSIHAHHHADDCATAAAAEGPIPRRSSSRSASSASLSRSLSASTSASMKSPAAASLRSMRNVAQSDPSSGVVSGPLARDPAVAQQQQQNPQEPPPSSPQTKTMNPQPIATTAATTTSTTLTASPRVVAAAGSVAAKAANSLSPAKRRSSPAEVPQSNPITTTTNADSADETSPKTSKRAKAEDNPPKILPQRYEYCAVADIVELIAHMIGELIATNDAIRPSNGGLTRFHSRTPPGISVRDYLHRLAKHATLTPPLLLAMVYYIDRLCLMYQQFTINTLTVHRFLITAATVAAKGLSDAFWNNATYARVGGVRLAELKLLELEFLHRVDWKIVPDPEVLVAYYRGLVERTPGYVLDSDGSSDDDLEDEEGEDEVEVSGSGEMC